MRIFRSTKLYFKDIYKNTAFLRVSKLVGRSYLNSSVLYEEDIVLSLLDIFHLVDGLKRCLMNYAPCKVIGRSSSNSYIQSPPTASNSVVELEPLCDLGYLDMFFFFCPNLAVLTTVQKCS